MEHRPESIADTTSDGVGASMMVGPSPESSLSPGLVRRAASRFLTASLVAMAGTGAATAANTAAGASPLPPSEPGNVVVLNEAVVTAPAITLAHSSRPDFVGEAVPMAEPDPAAVEGDPGTAPDESNAETTTTVNRGPDTRHGGDVAITAINLVPVVVASTVILAGCAGWGAAVWTRRRRVRPTPAA